MGFFDSLFGRTVSSREAPRPTRAAEIMQRANPNALIGHENGLVCMIEDVRDPDGRLYRLEIQATADGEHAIARVRHSPWGSLSDAHCQAGVICLGARFHGMDVPRSPYRLEDVILRARFWCTAVSVYHETGQFPSP